MPTNIQAKHSFSHQAFSPPGIQLNQKAQTKHQHCRVRNQLCRIGHPPQRPPSCVSTAPLASHWCATPGSVAVATTGDFWLRCKWSVSASSSTQQQHQQKRGWEGGMLQPGLASTQISVGHTTNPSDAKLEGQSRKRRCGCLICCFSVDICCPLTDLLPGLPR